MSEHPFQRFISLVEYDQETRALHTQVDELAKGIHALNRKQLEVQDAVAVAENALKSLKKSIESTELDMQTLDQKQKQKRSRLDEVAGNYKEFQALKREIEQLSVQLLEAEETLIGLWNKREAAEKDLAEQKKRLQVDLDALVAELQEKQKGLDEAQKALSQRGVERTVLVQMVPTEWLEKYEMMSMQVPDPVVPVLNGSCSACYYAITGSELSRLKHRALVQCKGCFRLLFMKEAMDEATK